MGTGDTQQTPNEGLSREQDARTPWCRGLHRGKRGAAALGRAGGETRGPSRCGALPPPGLTGAGLQDAAGDGRPRGGRHGEEREAVVVLGAARLDGPQVAVAPHAEAAGQIQRLHCLRLHLAENGLAHGLELVVELVVDLGRAAGDAWGGEGWDGARRGRRCSGGHLQHPPSVPTLGTRPSWDRGPYLAGGEGAPVALSPREHSRWRAAAGTVTDI